MHPTFDLADSSRNTRRRTVLTLAGLVAAAGLPASRADTWPSRPIRIVQGFAAGGNADTIARVTGGEMAKVLGQPIVVEAQTGAGGTIAATSVARAASDGYTLLLATGGHAVAGALYNALAYKSVDDFAMISTITYFPFLIVVPAGSPYQSFGDILKAAQAKPGAISYGSAGIGSTHHLAVELLASMAKVQLNHVPYRGDAASLTGLLSGDVGFVIAPPTAALGNIKAGKIRGLAVTGDTRWAGLPDLPTIAESGVPGYDVQSWAGLMAPAGTPPTIIEKLNASVQQALAVPAVRSRLQDMGGDVRGSTPAAMKTMVQNQLQKWTEVVASARIPRQ